MRVALVMLVAVLMLAGCTLPGPTPMPPTTTPKPVNIAATRTATLACCRDIGFLPPTATYSGARTHGLPTPGRFKVTLDNADSFFVTVEGDVPSTVTGYSIAWQADGWEEESRDNLGTTLIMRRPGERRVLLFGPVGESKTTTFVMVGAK